MISYKPLWKTLIDRDMRKQDLEKAAHINHTTIAKMGKGYPVTLSIIDRICTALGCGIGDVVEYVNNSII